MTLSIRKAGIIAGAAVLMSAASASAAFASNPINVSQSGGILTIDDPTGVDNSDVIKSNGSGTYDIQEVYSGNVLSVGSGFSIVATYSPTHVAVAPSQTVTKIVFHGRNGNDYANASGVTDVPVALYGDNDNDWLIGGTQNDTVSGGAGTDTVEGRGGNDVLTGFTGSDTIKGGDGDDTIYESDGYADSIDGGNGNDSATIDSTDTLISIETILP